MGSVVAILRHHEAIPARVLAVHVVNGMADEPVLVVAARTMRGGRIWERVVVSHRHVVGEPVAICAGVRHRIAPNWSE